MRLLHMVSDTADVINMFVISHSRLVACQVVYQSHILTYFDISEKNYWHNGLQIYFIFYIIIGTFTFHCLVVTSDTWRRGLLVPTCPHRCHVNMFDKQTVSRQ